MDLEEETEHTHTGLANMKRLLEILYHDRYCMKITGEKKCRNKGRNHSACRKGKRICGK